MRSNRHVLTCNLHGPLPVGYTHPLGCWPATTATACALYNSLFRSIFTLVKPKYEGSLSLVQPQTSPIGSNATYFCGPLTRSSQQPASTVPTSFAIYTWLRLLIFLSELTFKRFKRCKIVLCHDMTCNMIFFCFVLRLSCYRYIFVHLVLRFYFLASAHIKFTKCNGDGDGIRIYQI